MRRAISTVRRGISVLAVISAFAVVVHAGEPLVTKPESVRSVSDAEPVPDSGATSEPEVPAANDTVEETDPTDPTDESLDVLLREPPAGLPLDLPATYVPAGSALEAAALLDALEVEQVVGALVPESTTAGANAEPSLTLAAFSQASGRPSSVVRASRVAYGPCVLYPSVVYLRKSTDYRGVGTKPYTLCDRSVTSIRHETTLKYKSALWWRSHGPYVGTNYGAAGYTQKNVEFTCVSAESTNWAGTTDGKIVVGTKSYYARVYQSQVNLQCGG